MLTLAEPGYDSPDQPQTVPFLKVHKNEWGLKNASVKNSPLLVATGNKADRAMNRKEER